MFRDVQVSQINICAEIKFGCKLFSGEKILRGSCSFSDEKFCEVVE